MRDFNMFIALMWQVSFMGGMNAVVTNSVAGNVFFALVWLAFSGYAAWNVVKNVRKIKASL